MKNYFEGWYFKIVDETKDNSYAIIPGISFGKTLESSHSFIQILRGRDALSTYHEFGIDEFSYTRDDFQIQIGTNKFSLSGLYLNIQNNGIKNSADLEFDGIIPWPVTRLSPGAMGPFRFLPRIQCLHGILSFNHEIKGHAKFYNEHLDFSGGKGYIEKDWGKEFPSVWIWMQSNHFEDSTLSFTSSIATIPFLRRKFIGFLIGLLYDGKVYRFTTYNRAKISNIIVSNRRVSFEVSNKTHLIEISAKRSKGGSLQSPIDGLMTGRIHESLTAEIHLKIYEKQKNTKKLVFEDTGTNAGLEVVGDIDNLGATIDNS
jgi:hypothetical protein